MKKIFYLKPIDNFKLPWDKMYYSYMMGFVILAYTEEEARIMANKGGRYENNTGQSPWLNSALTSCEEIDLNSETRIIMYDECHDS